MNFKKFAAGFLVCTMGWTLCGCELVSVNTERDNAQVILSVGDKTYNKAIINGMVNSVLTMYGIEDANSAEYDEYRYEMAESFASEKAFQFYAVQNGYMDKLTDEDKKEIEDSYEETRKYYEEEIYEEVKTELGYTDAEDAPEFTQAAEEKVKKETEKRQKEYLASYGVTSLEEYKTYLTEQKAADLYTEHLESTVSVTDEDVKQHYDTLMSEQKEQYDADPGAFIDSFNEDTINVYTPGGFRRVKHVLIKIDDESAEKIASLEKEIEALEDGEAKTNKQSELDIIKKDVFGKIEAKAKDVQSKAKSGTDFDSLIAQYGEDEGTATNPDGYLMHANATGTYEENFQTAGMALGKVGDISELVETSYGYHILMYASDVQAGEKAYSDELKAALKDDVLSDKKDAVVSQKTTEILDGYKADGTVKIYLDRLKTAAVPGK